MRFVERHGKLEQRWTGNQYSVASRLKADVWSRGNEFCFALSQEREIAALSYFVTLPNWVIKGSAPLHVMRYYVLDI